MTMPHLPCGTLKDESFAFQSRARRTGYTKRYGDGEIHFSWFISYQTDHPPQPVPLTIGCMLVFVTPVGIVRRDPGPTNSYVDPRSKACPSLRWSRMAFPSKAQNIEILEAFEPLASVTGILHMPNHTVIELGATDGRFYEHHSLPGVVAGRGTFYHHCIEPFYHSMKDYVCAESIYTASTTGLKVRNANGKEFLTVANHVFLQGTVYHLRVGGDIVGHIFDRNRRPELDIALVSFAPDIVQLCSNESYFQAQTLSTFLKRNQIVGGSWGEIDGMSLGLVAMMVRAAQIRKPKRPPGHSLFEHKDWRIEIIHAIFSVMSGPMADGVCGTPIVDCDTGEVGGFFFISPMACFV
ncbi:hypothetical protein N7495_004050 [Penicillium taxi]|uniref:uncharacterized protein n=1 Tax=Penicillium taxi TaxID=168475 RepID=UPI0025454267|nr:uncharacterized protein N7495_004050 [Penicillium taxi]KAJ5899306.1 hypothetical protein N7495_004050 [Penicillium taxi]